MVQIFSIVSLLFASAFYVGNDFHGTRMFVFMIMGSLWIAVVAWRKIHWSVGLVLFWSLFSAAAVFQQPVSPFINFGDMAVLAFDALSATTYLSILLVASALLLSKRETLDSLLAAFSWLCILDSLFVIVQWALGHSTTDRGGFFGNASMNACVIACTYPILKRTYRAPLGTWHAITGLTALIAPILAVLASRSNMALLALLSSFVAPCIVSAFRFGWRKVLKFYAAALALLVCGLWFMGPKFGDNNGRVPVWVADMRWWWANANHWMGTGTGTYFGIGPSIQIQTLHQTTAHFLWMHNDWLQILFEQGAIGLGLTSAMFVRAISECLKPNRPIWILSALSAYAVTMLGNFPTHLPVPGFLGAFLIVKAFDGYAVENKNE